MQPITLMISRSVLLSFFIGCLLSPAALAGGMNGNPAPGGNNVQNTGSNPQMTDSLYAQKQRLRDKYQFINSYWNSWQSNPVNEVFQGSDGTQSTYLNGLQGEQYQQKTAPSAQPTRVEATGFILPTGYYVWDGRIGMVPNPTMAMPGYVSPMKVQDSGIIGPTMALLDAVDPTHSLRTTTITNQDFGAIMSAKGELLNQLRQQPDRWRTAARADMEMKQSVQGDNTAVGAEQNTNAGWDNVALPLINIANEEAWQPCDPETPWKSYANAAWMVGQMYKQVYIPMAILLLLPGTILTQLKVIVKSGFIPDSPVAPDYDMMSPFSGIMRAVIAVFLIPATQLFVSYTIDVGNSLTYEVVNSPYWDLNTLKQWRSEQTYDAKLGNQLNYYQNNPESQMEGKLFGTDDNKVVLERQNYLTSTNQQWFNTLNALLGQGMVALNAFQLVIIMYLFLLGPVAAALFAWPGLGSELFRYIYSNWMDGVVLVTLWKFWWAVILLTAMVRLEVNTAAGIIPPTLDQFEMFMCASFCTLLLYVPFNPFDFKPGACVDQVLSTAQSQVSKGGSGAAVAGATSPTGGSGSQGHQAAEMKGPAGGGQKR